MHIPIVVLLMLASGSVCHHAQSLHKPQLDVVIPVILSWGNLSEMLSDLVSSPSWSFLQLLQSCNVCASHTARHQQMDGPASLRHPGHVLLEGGMSEGIWVGAKNGKKVMLADISLKMNGPL
jgi:hypothetical protein